jgi:hypothetical protein
MITSPSMMGAMRDQADNRVFHIVGAGGPLSGSISRTDVLPTGFNVCGFGSTYTDLTNGAVYINEGTNVNLYWTPSGYNQPGIFGGWDDFRGVLLAALSDTVAGVQLASGVRLFGAGVDEIDGGGVVSIGEGGPVLRLTSSATANLPAALGLGIDASVPFQPDTHGPLVVDSLFTVVTDLLTKRVFQGFIGTAANALVSPVTGSTVTLTLVQDDVAGVMFDSALTDAAGLMAPHNKSDEAATLLVTAAGVDLGVDISAVATYQRMRVEISRAGVMTIFKDKIQIGQILAALDANEETAPVLLVSGTTSAVDIIDVKYFGAWGVRPQGA